MTTQPVEDIVLDIALRMSDPDSVRKFMLDPSNSNPYPFVHNKIAWQNLSLAGGYPGMVLLFNALERNGLVKGEIVHHYILKIKEAIEDEGFVNPSLFNGICGACFALQAASMDGMRYQRMLQNIQSYLLESIESYYLEPLRTNREQNQPVFSYLHDLIQGLCGVGRYVLENLFIPDFFEMAKKITTTLINFTKPLQVHGHSVPGWYLSPNDTLNTWHKEDSKGNFNLGLAHGIPGILAFLAIASLKGVEVKGQKETMMEIASWIRQKSFNKNDTIRWPYSVPWELEIQKKTRDEDSKDAWCYGVPGIARALFLAGKALEDTELKSFAITAFRGVFCRTRKEWQLHGPMLCHGIAGLLMLTHEMAKEKECGDLIVKVNELKQILLSYYNSDSPFGFKDVELSTQGNVEISKAGFLEGSAGVLLTLLSTSDQNFKWHLPLMISS